LLGRNQSFLPPPGPVSPMAYSGTKAGASMAIVNAADVTPSSVSVKLLIVTAVALALAARVSVHELPLIVTLPELPTVTPLGRFATVTIYVPLAIFAFVTG